MSEIMYENLNVDRIKIRSHFDEKTSEFYYSITDIIENLHLSTDPRNYWKVLKNRLKKGHNKLVTECNQLKMKSSDGKSYLTDVANTHTILQIIKLVSPLKVATFEEFFNHLEGKNGIVNKEEIYTQDKLSTVSFDDGEIEVDMYQNDNCIFIKAMIAGVPPQDISISLNCKILTIKVTRVRHPASPSSSRTEAGQGGNSESEENYKYQELYWGKFSRTITLPYEVDIDRSEAKSSYGLLIIKLPILDKTRTKIIKVN